MDNTKKYDLLILERVKHVLDAKPVITEDGKTSFTLEGIFGEIGIKNKNNRIYSEDQYLPQVESLQEKIGKNKLLGELDHPKEFEVCLSNASHIIEKLEYDKENKVVKGKIRLLSTPKGEIAKSLIRDGVPLHISSRAAGSVDEKGNVTIKKLFTYDLVADPGFESAELARVNEKYNFESDDSLFIYEVNDITENDANSSTDSDKYKNTDKNTDITMENKYVPMEDFIKYSDYVKSTFKGIEESIKSDDREFLIKYVNKITEKLNLLGENLHNLSEKFETLNSATTTDKVTEEHGKFKTYFNYMAKLIDNGITDINELKASFANLEEKADYLEQELEYNTDYTKYLAKEQDKTIQYSEEIAEKADYGLQYAEYQAHLLNEAIGKGIKLDEEVNTLCEYNGYIKPVVEGLGNYVNDLGKKINQIVDTVNEEDTFTDKTEVTNEEITYKNSINEKLNQIIASATKQKVDSGYDYNFLNLLDAGRKNEFMSFNDEKRKLITEAFKNNKVATIEDVTKVYEKLVRPETKSLDFIDNMPDKYKAAWSNLSESQKETITAQAKYHKLETQYQINTFWAERDLRPEKINLQKVNESDVVEIVKANDSYMSSFEQEMRRRFNK